MSCCFLCHWCNSSEAQALSYVTGVLGATHVEIEHHLEMGRKLLAAGQLAEALSHYHSAVGKVTHRRGTHTHTHTHTHSDTFILSPLADIFSLCSSNACPLPYPHLTFSPRIMPLSTDEKLSVFRCILQRETPRITWPTTSELRCSWRWENPNPPCRIWPKPSSSSPTSWL